MNEYLLTALVSVVTSLGAWFVARRKNLADVQNSELDNVDKAVKIYREQLEDIAQRWKSATDELDSLNKLYRIAISDINRLELQATKWQSQVDAMQQINAELVEQNKALIEELKKYKQLNGKTATP